MFLIINASKKQKKVRAKQANFMDAELNHAIMIRSKLRHNYLKNRSNKDREAYKKQRNLRVDLLRHKKRDYFKAFRFIICDPL